MAVKKSLKNLKFDEALAMLEEKVKLLEEGNLPLEESQAGLIPQGRQLNRLWKQAAVIQQNLLRRLMNRWILKNIILTGKN